MTGNNKFSIRKYHFPNALTTDQTVRYEVDEDFLPNKNTEVLMFTQFECY